MISIEDIGPNDNDNTELKANVSPTGVIIGLAGDGNALYAASLNAGIWKSVGGGAWQQLPGSPARAYCIAQDPNDPSHLIVGERATEAIKRQAIGVWESRDGGATWSYVLDPSTVRTSNSQAIAATMFSAKSSAFVGTVGGIGRKAVGHDAFDFVFGPLGQHPDERVTAFARSESNDVYLEERLAGANAAGEILLYSWTPKLDWRVTNLTTSTSVRAASALTNWQTPSGPVTVEHLAFTDTAGHVIVLYSSERGDWQVVDLTAKTGQVIRGSLTSWQTPNGPYNVEHLAGVNPSGDVIVFVWSPAHDWQAINVSAKTGQQSLTPLTSWQTLNGPYNVEHLAGVSPSGDVIVFVWSPAHDWQAINVSAKTGQQSLTPLTSWQTFNGPYNVEHLAGVSRSGDVIVFIWSPAHDWQAINVSAKTGQKISTPLSSWQTPNGPYSVEHLAGASPSGDVIVFVWSPAHDWQAINVTAKTGQKILTPLTSWQTPNGPYNVEHLAGVSPSGDVVVFVWSPAHDWQAIDVSNRTGAQARGALTSWQRSNRLQFIFARTASQVVFSPDDGVTWSARSFVKQVTIPTTVVGSTVVPAGTYDVEVDARPNGGDDRLGLAAVDSTIYVPCVLFEPGRRDAASRPAKNLNTLLIGDPLSNQWTAQITDRGNGTGLGGRRFLKSYVLNRPDLQGGIGGRARLFDSTADDILVATRLQEGTIDWSEFASTFIGSRPPDRIHSDIWDFHLSPDGNLAWVACDGGVFRGDVPSGTWKEWNDGLHAHHVHTLTVLLGTPGTRAKLAYPTADNDGWYRGSSAVAGPAPAWRNTTVLGDANWTAGDAGNLGVAVIARHLMSATLVAFGDPPPVGANFTEGASLRLRNDLAFDGPLGFQCIQTLSGESPTYPLLDAVMLVNLPLLDEAGKPVPGALGQPNLGGLPALIRNTKFAAAPSASSLFSGWAIEASDLPRGTRGFWVAGGHASPTYYAYAASGVSLSLFKKGAGNIWNRLPITNLTDGAQFGPCFVNPYDANIIYALTTGGVQLSKDGGVSFALDVTLTNLISGSGAYPIGGAIDVSSAFQELGGRGRAVNGVMATLSHMAFFRDDPRVACAASPFTGVFYYDGRSWLDLSDALPKPLAPVSSVGIDAQSIYVAFEGRGVVHLDGYNK